MPDRFDRRSFIARGMRTGLGAAALGGAPALLSACSSSKSGYGTGGSSNGSANVPVPASPNVGISHLPPRRGGTLIVGTYSEAEDLVPATSEFDSTAMTYANAVYDLMAVLTAGTGNTPVVKPYLLESFTPNSTYEAWTLKLRPNISYHDGTPFNADAVVANIFSLQKGLITSQAAKPIVEAVKVDDLTVTVLMDGPWVAFPALLTGQGGFAIHPKYIHSDGSVDSDAANANPIGTGPFVFESWVRGTAFQVRANKNYWRPGLPYLGAIEFRPLPDDQSREATLRSGGINVMHSQDPNNYTDLAGDTSYQVYNDAHGVIGEPSIDCLIVNCQGGPSGSGPTSDLRIRQALAYGSNRDLIRADFFANIPELANDGLFMPGDPWYSPASLYPGFDPAKARSLVKAYQADNPGPVNITVTGPSVTRYINIMEAFQTMWQATGITVTISQMLQSAYVSKIPFGNYEVGLFQFFGAADPDANYPFFISDNVGPPGGLALNLARFKSTDVDSSLKIGRTNPDPQARIEAYKTLNKALVQGLPYLFGWQTLWIEAADNKTMNFRGLTTPEGSISSGFNAGSMTFTETWLSQ